ncbi:TPA: S-type pyocin domain-containing protein [Serratia fonticola]
MTDYNKIDPFERQVMESLGYRWVTRDEGSWQKGEINGDTITVTAWHGPPPTTPKITEKPHLWDQKISDMNQSKTDIFDDDVIVPVSEGAKDISRKESDEKIQYLSNIEIDIRSGLKTITEDIRKIELQNIERQSTSSELEKSKYQLTLAKLKLEQKNQQILCDEIKKRRVHEEYLKLNNEEHFYAREKPSSVAQQKKENRVKMGEKLAEERAIQEQIEKDKQALPLLESDVRVKEQNVNRLTEEAKARAEAEAEAKAKLAALMTRAGVNPTPTYTQEMVKSAQASLVAAGGMVLNRAPGMLQLTAAAEGVLTTASELAGSVAGALWRGAAELSRIATVSTLGATVGTLVIGFWPKEVGLGSDQILGRDMELFAAQAQLFAAGKVNITPEMTSVNLPVRGLLVTENGRQNVSLVKTGIAGVSANVPVLRAVRDEKTGLDKITLPAVAGAPSRTILINPVPIGPTAPSNTGNSLPIPVTPVHTGTTIKQADSIVTTTFPAEDIKGLRDFIYWQPDATGSGVEPIYVMLSAPPKSVVHNHKHYPPKGVPWKDIVRTTANKGKAKFKPDVNIPRIDIDVWSTGQTTKTHPDWKVKQYDHIIGAYDGKETQWVVVKESQGVIHSHPISEQKVKELMK